MGEHIEIKDLGIYRQALEISEFAWEIYKNFDWRIKKIIGDQFIEAVDSIGANIAEGYGRYHYEEGDYQRLTEDLGKLNHSLNAYIKSLYKSKANILISSI